MTVEETKKAIKVMQAFVDGKQIQAVTYNGDWVNVKPGWKWGDSPETYRIKPELRPYKNREEFMKAMKEHDGWLFSKNYYYATTPVYVDNCGIDITGGAGSDENYGHESLTFKELLEQFTWMDGSACGVMEEEL